MADSLTGRIALVTGVSRRAGIGFAVTRRLLAEGAAVYAQGWTPHDATQSWGSDSEGASAVRALGDRVRYSEADFADPDAPRALLDAAQAAFGHVDLLIVNHARSGYGRLADVTAAELDAFLRENVRASILLVKEFAAQHDGRPGGRVVLMTSGQHLAAMTREVAYAISKGALQQATKTLAHELIDRGITVNTVNPGQTYTGWEHHRSRPSTRNAPRPLGRTRRRRPVDRLALQRRRTLDHGPSDRLRRRLSPLTDEPVALRSFADARACEWLRAAEFV